MVRTARALELAPLVADVLARARRVIATAEPFDPATSKRRFTIGAPDGVSAVFLAPLLAALGGAAPGVDIGLRQLLPTPGETSPERAWRNVLAELDERALDIAVLPSGPIPARFRSRNLYEEDVVIAMRAGHPFADDPTLERYAKLRHLVVSLTSDPIGFVDERLAKQGPSRRIALTVPNLMLALAVIAEADPIAALPRRFVAIHAARIPVWALDPPLPLPRFRLSLIAPKVGMMDAGLAWLFGVLAEAGQPPAPHRKCAPKPRS